MDRFPVPLRIEQMYGSVQQAGQLGGAEAAAVGAGIATVEHAQGVAGAGAGLDDQTAVEDAVQVSLTGS